MIQAGPKTDAARQAFTASFWLMYLTAATTGLLQDLGVVSVIGAALLLVLIVWAVVAFWRLSALLAWPWFVQLVAVCFLFLPLLNIVFAWLMGRYSRDAWGAVGEWKAKGQVEGAG